MSEYNNIEAKLEKVFSHLLGLAIPAGVTHYPGQTDEGLSLPRTWSAAQQPFTELVPGSATGNFRGIMEIGVQSLAVLTDGDGQSASNLAAHQSLVAQARDGILTATLVADLNAAAAALGLELTVVDVLNPSPSQEQETTSSYTNLLHLEVIAANATL